MITVVGIGPGSREFILNKSVTVIQQANLVIGSERQLAVFPEIAEDKRKLLPKKLSDLKTILRENQRDVVVLASGDPLLYGIGNWLSDQLDDQEVLVVPGISAIHYLFAKAKLSQNDCYLTSSHGKRPDLELLLNLPKVAMVTDQQFGPYEIAQAVIGAKKKKKMLVGENLSYPQEKITWLLPEEVLQRHYEMNVVVIIDA